MRRVLFSSFIFMASSSAFCMPTLIEGQEDLPQNASLCASASISAYNRNADQARTALDGLHYHQGQQHENVNLTLRAETWEAEDKNQVVIAYRGTEPTLQNIFADAAITKYAAVGKPDSWAYLVQHLEGIVTHWRQSKWISEEESKDFLVKYLPSTSTLQTARNVTYGTVGAGGLIAAASLPPLGAALATGVAVYGFQQTIGGHYAHNKATNTLQLTTKEAFEFSEKVIGGYDRPIQVIYTGHSLGGFVADVVSELSSKKGSPTTIFNAPGGVENFIKENKKYIMGGKDDWATWGKKLFVNVQEDFPHEFQMNAINIARSHCLVGRVGGDDATRRSILVEDYQAKDPLPIERYLLTNHGVRELAKELHPDLYQTN